MFVEARSNNINIFEYIINLFKRDIVFSAAFVLAVGSCFFVRPSVDCINFKVLASLLSLMIVVKALEDMKLLDKAAVSILVKCKDSRTVSLVLIILTFFSSMFITNDVALITFVPLTLIIEKKSRIRAMEIIIMQTLAANIGSSLTPMGNPQNLYLFSFYRLSVMQFFSTIILFFITGFIFLYLLNLGIKRKELKLTLSSINIDDPLKAAAWLLLFIVIILSVFGVIDYKAALAVTLVTAFILNKNIFFTVDYTLLITFVCFFIFIGNISRIGFINNYLAHILSSKNSTYWGSILISQIISNVPCAILLSNFTTNWRELLLGVNIGGMGTLIASLASVISYKLYVREHSEYSGKYLVKFSIYNFAGLIIFAFLNFLV